MLLYGDDTSAWNAVDVLLDDGQLQHGRVINVVEGGLMIDFQCPAQRSHFVEYGRLFRCIPNEPFWQEIEQVQVLLRRHPDGAWIWYPGRVLPLAVQEYSRAEWIEMQLPHGSVNELLLRAQGRLPPTDAELREQAVAEKDFVIRSCPLPTTYWSEVSRVLRQIFQEELNQRHHVLCTSLLSQALLYLQSRSAVPLTVEQVEATYHKARKDVESGCLSWTAQRILRQNSVDADREKRKRPAHRGARLPLPVELQLEIFQSLDSVERIRCRRVCSLWNCLLTTDAYFPDVHVSGRCYDEHTGEMHWVLACLLKCPSPASKVVIIKDLRCWDILGDPKRLVHNLWKSNVPTLVFYQCDIAHTSEYMEKVVMRMTQMVVGVAAAERIWWKECRVHGIRVQAVVTADFSPGELDREDLEEQMWDLFERSLILKKPVDRLALAESFADYVAHKRTANVDKRIVEALNYDQEVDPREAAYYRDREWTPADLGDVDVGKLNTVTAVVLRAILDLVS